jgi:hypothetical protein
VVVVGNMVPAVVPVVVVRIVVETVVVDAGTVDMVGIEPVVELVGRLDLSELVVDC